MATPIDNLSRRSEAGDNAQQKKIYRGLTQFFEAKYFT